ncbi:MAG: hypothetical protein IJ811_00740 [Clostridia bacterium]|nr:hypothetical protein [Clostridia bacterium]
MKIRIEPFQVSGECVCPPSKSYAIRYIIAGFLSKKRLTVRNAGDCDDVRLTVNAVNTLGANAIKVGDDVELYPFENFVSGAHVDVGECASLYRMLVPIVCALNVKTSFSMSDKLKKRVDNDVIDGLFAAGLTFQNGVFGGSFNGQKIVLYADKTSQYLSGALLALAYLGGGAVQVVGDIVSLGYVFTTICVLNTFGADVDFNGRTFTVKGGYKGVRKVKVEGDFSSASAVFALGAVGGRVCVDRLNTESKQPDIAIIDLLRDFGAKVDVDGEKVTVEKGEFKPIKLDCNLYPDLFPVCCALAAYAKGESVFFGVDRLKYKETDRLLAMRKTLSAAGVQSRLENDRLVVCGKGEIKGTEFPKFSDHRVVMAQIVLSCGANCESKIDAAESLSKSYPAFLEHLRAVGGLFDVIV